jgi:hypothetical protein
MTQQDTDKKDSGFLDFIRRNIEAEVSETRNLFSWAGNNIANVMESFVDYAKGDEDVWTRGTTADSFVMPGFRANHVNDMLSELEDIDNMSYDEITKVFTSREYGVPNTFNRFVKTDWGESERVVLDPDNKEGVRQQINKLISEGYTKTLDPIPHKIEQEDGQFVDSG